MSLLREALSNGLLVCDGAMGTEILRRLSDAPRPLDMLSLTDPRLIMSIHAQYLACGARMITTNTFNAATLAADPAQPARQLKELVQAAIALARRAIAEATAPKLSGRRVAKLFVAFSVGPIDGTLGAVTHDKALDSYRKVFVMMADARCDMALVETVTDSRTAIVALEALSHVHRTGGQSFVTAVSFTVRMHDGMLYDSTDPAMVLLDVAARTGGWAPDVVGLNCCDGIGGNFKAVMASFMTRVRAILPRAWFLCRPSAGIKKMVEPDDFAESLVEIIRDTCTWDPTVNSRMVLVGGCCGTTPEHIGKLAERVEKLYGKEGG